MAVSGGTVAETITIDPRFRGPVTSGNGGVSAGLIAGFVEGPATVRLRRPPPLGRPLRVRRAAGRVEAVDADEVVMEAAAATHPVDLPIDPGTILAAFARGTTPVPADYRVPGCFVCGSREDGLRIFPHHLPGTQVWATVWIPDVSVSADGVTVDPHIVWGALDCPAGLAVVRYGLADPKFFPVLARLTARLEHPLAVGNPVAVFGWMIDEDERRINGGTAIVDANGTVLASAYAQHARLPLDFADT